MGENGATNRRAVNGMLPFAILPLGGVITATTTIFPVYTIPMNEEKRRNHLLSITLLKFRTTH